MSILSIFFGTDPKMIQTSMMFNKASGAYWCAEATLNKDGSYDIGTYNAEVVTCSQNFTGHHPNGGGSFNFEMGSKRWALNPLSSEQAIDVVACVERMGALRKAMWDNGYRPELNLIAPRYPSSNLESTAWLNGIKLPVLK